MIQKTGGVLVALRYADDWAKRGHGVHVYYPLFLDSAHIRHRNPLKKLLSNILYARRNWIAYRKWVNAAFPQWVQGQFKLHLVRSIRSSALPQADVTVATAWTTAYSAVANRERAGKLVYFIQHYETWDGQVDRVENSYRLGLQNVVIAPWLDELVQKNSPASPPILIPNGIDTNVFSPPTAAKARCGVLTMYHESPIKGVDVALKIFEAIHAEDASIPLRIFGVNSRPAIIPSYVDYVQNPTPEQLVELYREAEFFISACASEGWGLTIIEALACGCIPFSPLTGCVPLVNADQELVQVFPAGDVGFVLEKIREIRQSPQAMSDLSKACAERAKGFSWEPSLAKFRAVLEF